MVTIVINKRGVAQRTFARVEEHAICGFGCDASVKPHPNDLLEKPAEGENVAEPRWERLLRGGQGSRRQDSPGLFYPVYIDPQTKTITEVGAAFDRNSDPDLRNLADRRVAWPIKRNGSLGRWQVGPMKLRELVAQGFVKLGGFDEKRKTWTILYLASKSLRQLERGVIKIVGRDPVTNAVEIKFTEHEEKIIKTVWFQPSHESGPYGSTLLSSILGERGQFSFPKSLYSVTDMLRAVCQTKESFILDFFAGSGTTFHAASLLNATDGGTRRTILVTNNEVSEGPANEMIKSGLTPGDHEFEQSGICEAVTWPRCKSVVTGGREDGVELPGEYLCAGANGEEIALSEGLPENVEYFRLEFLDPDEVARGDAFKAIVPILWMVAGCRGEREDSKGSTPWFIPMHSPFAVLIQEKLFRGFREKLAERKDIEWVFLITDSEENFGQMRRTLGRKYECVQLYKSYLENFRINTQDALNG